VRIVERVLLSHQFALDFGILHDVDKLVQFVVFCLATGIAEISTRDEVESLRKENWSANLNREFDVATIVCHVVERLLHVCPKVGSVLQHGSKLQYMIIKRMYGSRFSRNLVRKSSNSERGRPTD
jgi:hypothetical protein